MKHFVDEDHAIYVGWVLGLATWAGLPVEPVVDEDGDYTDRLCLLLPVDKESHTGLRVELIVPPPAVDWVLLPPRP